MFVVLYFSNSYDFSEYSGFSLLALVFMVRNVRTFQFMIEFDSMRLIYETTRHISRPILGKFLFIYLVFYYYAAFGQIFFGGKLTNQSFKEKCTDTPTFYDLLNFNDYSAAMVTLFQQMVVNNWFVTVNMYSDVMGETVWVRLYFVSFWIAIVLI